METTADRDARLQAALVAVRDACGDIGGAWLTQRGTSSVGGHLRVTVLLEPVWQPLTLPDVILALGRHGIRPRTVRPRAGIDLRASHAATAIEIDVALAPKLSARTAKVLDQALGRGWRKRRPD